MARTYRPVRRKEGKGLGEILSESFVYIAILVALAFAARWYFFVHLRSPEAALSNFIGAVKSGNVDKQFELLSASSKSAWSSKSDYDNKHPLGHGLSGRIQSFDIRGVKKTGDTAEAEVQMRIRRSGQELYQASTDSYTDRYVLVKEKDGWRIALERSSLQSLQAASGGR